MTNFVYDDTVPAANDNPSDDQPDMLVNAQSIEGIIAIDHVGFNLDSGGQHLQVTFNSNNVPSIPTSPPVLFTDTPEPLTNPGLFFYSGSNALNTSDQYQINTTQPYASTFLTNGLILKTGRFSAIGSGTTTVALTYSSIGLNAFPNGTLTINFTSAVPATTATINISDGSLTASGFTIVKSSTAAVTIYFLAIGY